MRHMQPLQEQKPQHGLEKGQTIGSESNKHHDWIGEPIEIRKQTLGTIDSDEGAYILTHTWDAVVSKTRHENIM